MRFFILLVLSLSVLSCNNNDDQNLPDCSLVDCAINDLNLELISASSRENLFENGTLTEEELTITIIETSDEVPLMLYQDILNIPLASYADGPSQITYQISTNEELLFEVSFYSEPDTATNVCCPNTRIENVSFGDTTIEVVNEALFSYKVFLDL